MADAIRVPRKATLLALLALTAVAPAPAHAVTSGGAAVPGGVSVPDDVGASAPTTVPDVAPKTPTGTRSSSLRLTSFTVNGGRFYEHGRSIRVGFELSGRSSASAKLKLVVVQAGNRVRVVDLGARVAGVAHSVIVPTAGLPSGELSLRISGRDARGRAVRRGPSAASSHAISVQSHRFPIVGQHSFGGEGSRFGAGRPGHIHQGQDVSAPEGTPMVAARGGVVRFTGNQPGGAGVYLVIRGAGESRDYVYMHLVEGSMVVRQGQTVRTGQLIGKVGQTGAASGAHLHFEIWQGAWQQGGSPIDPLPLLQRWDAWS
jgi:murein DD-endopeptidase MepM/ murein hydrolase activator NlpD